MKLCKFCNSSKGNSFSEGECYICGGALLALPEIAKKAAKALPAAAATFSLATSIPADWLIREEQCWDEKLGDTVCIKSKINQLLNYEIAKLAGKRSVTDGDVTLVLDIVPKTVAVRYNDLFVFGRYKKLAAGLSQTRWICSKCSGKGCKECSNTGKFYYSVEEEIGAALKEAFKAAAYTMHASGREDIDVTNAAGRPFIMQLSQAQVRDADLKVASEKINHGAKVEVSNLQLAKRGDVELISASHFDKAYVAAVEFENPPSSAQLKQLLSLAGRSIEQQTPARVQHRRANLVRSRKILSLKLVSQKGKTAEFEIVAEAGTYIKELITGDSSRTRPSFSSVLNTPVACTSLRVSKIHDDFLDSYFKR